MILLRTFLYIVEMLNYLREECLDSMEDEVDLAGSNDFEQVTRHGFDFFTTKEFGIIPVKVKKVWDASYSTPDSVKIQVKKQLVRLERKK